MEKIIGLVILLLIVIALVSYLVGLYNKLIALNFNVKKAFANIDVLLKQRADEIPNLIKVVKEYMTYEKSVLSELTELRTQFFNPSSENDKVKTANNISKSLGKIIAVSENYPDLKANASFINLQERLSKIEDHIADRRELFNESVNMYNIGIHEFPNVIFSKLIGYKEKALLEITEKENSTMEFSFKHYVLFKEVNGSPESMFLWVILGFPLCVLFVSTFLRVLIPVSIRKMINIILWGAVSLSWISSIVLLMVFFPIEVSGFKLLIIWFFSFVIAIVFSINNRFGLEKLYEDLLERATSKKYKG